MPSLYLEVSSINQNPIVNIEVSSFFNMKVPSFVVDSFEDLVDLGLYCSHSMEPFFCSGGGEFVVIMEVYGACIQAIETSVGGEFICCGGCDVIGTFCER